MPSVADSLATSTIAKARNLLSLGTTKRCPNSKKNNLVDFVKLKCIQCMFIYMPRSVAGDNSLDEYEVMHSTHKNNGNCIIVSHFEDKGWEGASEIIGLRELVGEKPGM